MPKDDNNFLAKLISTAQNKKRRESVGIEDSKAEKAGEANTMKDSDKGFIS